MTTTLQTDRLSLEGDWTAPQVESLAQALRERLEPSAVAVVDARDVRAVDGAGLQLMVSLDKTLRAAGAAPQWLVSESLRPLIAFGLPLDQEKTHG